MVLHMVAFVVGGWLCGAQAPEQVSPHSRDGAVPSPQPITAPFYPTDLLPLIGRYPPLGRVLKDSTLLFRCFTNSLGQEDVESLLGKPSFRLSIGPYLHVRYPRVQANLVFDDKGCLRYVQSLWLQRPETLPPAVRGDLLGLQGFWTLAATEQDGKKVAEADFAGLSGVAAVIEGNHLTLGPAVALPCRFRIARSGATGTFSLLPPRPGGEEEWREFQRAAPTKGVYRLVGDLLEVQFRAPGDPPGFDRKSKKYPVFHFKKKGPK